MFANFKIFLALPEDEDEAKIAESLLIEQSVIKNSLSCSQSDTDTVLTDEEKMYVMLEDGERRRNVSICM